MDYISYKPYSLSYRYLNINNIQDAYVGKNLYVYTGRPQEIYRSVEDVLYVVNEQGLIRVKNIKRDKKFTTVCTDSVKSFKQNIVKAYIDYNHQLKYQKYGGNELLYAIYPLIPPTNSIVKNARKC